MNDRSEPERLSFCATCKNRLWQLRHTLPVNLAAVKAAGRAEIVVVNYNSRDDLDQWIRQFQQEIDEGWLRYVYERTEPYFHASKAKNLAHFAATGQFLINLDGDNFIGETIHAFRLAWAEDSEFVIQGFCGDYADGTYGRIGMKAEHFRALGGYDEEMWPMAHQDRDLLSRARAMGFKVKRLKQQGMPAIRNNIHEKMKHLGTSCPHAEMSRLNSARLEESIRLGRLIANQTRQPVEVLLNFAETIRI